MSKILTVMALSLLGASVAQAQSVDISKKLYSCEHRGVNGQFVMRKDFLSVSAPDAVRLSHVSELQLIEDFGPKRRWVLTSDLDYLRDSYPSKTPVAQPSSTFVDGIDTVCNETSHPSAPTYGNFKFYRKNPYNCQLVAQDRNKFIAKLPYTIDAMNWDQALTIARVSEGKQLSNRFILYTDYYSNNPIKPSYYTLGFYALCQLANQAPNSTQDQPSQ